MCTVILKNMKTIYLSMEAMASLFGIVKAEIARKGADFYGWKNAPVVIDNKLCKVVGYGEGAKNEEITAQEAVEIFEAKLNGAYGERFAITIALLAGLIRQGKKVALLQINKEEGVPFNASGWLVASIEGFPMFHLAPWDLPMAEVQKAGLVTIVAEGSEEAEIHGWKGTDKTQELSSLLNWML